MSKIVTEKGSRVEKSAEEIPVESIPDSRIKPV
jgi:hypothetical protein